MSTTYAIIEESGGQRKVTEGEQILIDLLDAGQAAVGKAVKFDRVLVVGGGDGSATKIGTPYVKGSSVAAEVVEPVVMGEKIDIHKFRAKKGYRLKTGHRQRYTKVQVTSIKG